jgi:hypothetical protein
LLLGIQGVREVVRLRNDHEQIQVLPLAKGEEVVTAARRRRVGSKDPDELAREIELRKRLRKQMGETVPRREFDRESDFSAADPQPEAPRTIQMIRPSEFCTAEEAPLPTAEREISSSEYFMASDQHKKRKRFFADLEG